jgi:predicted phage tail protein
MSETEMVKIGCKLPQGMILEVGYSVVTQGKDGGKSISVHQHDDYQRVRVKGWTHVDGSKQAYHSGLLLPPNTSLSNPQVAVTDVPAAFFARWKKEHAAMWKKLTGSGVMFEVADEASAKSAVALAKTVKSGFEAKDPVKPGPGVTKANFDSDE